MPNTLYYYRTENSKTAFIGIVPIQSSSNTEHKQSTEQQGCPFTAVKNTKWISQFERNSAFSQKTTYTLTMQPSFIPWVNTHINWKLMSHKFHQGDVYSNFTYRYPNLQAPKRAFSCERTESGAGTEGTVFWDKQKWTLKPQKIWRKLPTIYANSFQLSLWDSMNHNFFTLKNLFIFVYGHFAWINVKCTT